MTFPSIVRPYGQPGFLLAPEVTQLLPFDLDPEASPIDCKFSGSVIEDLMRVLPPRNLLDVGVEGAPTFSMLTKIVSGDPKYRLIYEGYIILGDGERVSLTGVQIPVDLISEGVVEHISFYDPHLEVLWGGVMNGFSYRFWWE